MIPSPVQPKARVDPIIWIAGVLGSVLLIILTIVALRPKDPPASIRSSVTAVDPVKPATPPKQVEDFTSLRLANGFAANPIAANDHLAAVRVRLSEPIYQIADTGMATLVFRAEGWLIQFDFPDSFRGRIANLTPGQTVTVVGEFANRGTENPKCLRFVGSSLD